MTPTGELVASGRWPVASGRVGRVKRGPPGPAQTRWRASVTQWWASFHSAHPTRIVPTYLVLLGAILAAILCPTVSPAAADADAEEQAALDAAVDRVAPSVVRIETVAGLEKVEDVLFGAGLTTGLVVDPQGYIISSAFVFAHKPSAILIQLQSGQRRPARLVATDHSRMLVLLKIDVEKPLAVCEMAPRSVLRVGQWAIAVGRTFENRRPNMAVGILSALSRISGKAIQTDAAVSPSSYGGPLLDIRGRVIGVLVPLSPQSGEVAGLEWYDSGIGFAVPMDHIQKMLPRLKSGEDLYPGLAGINLQGHSSPIGEPTVAACRPKSPAAVAGVKPGDRIIEIDGRAIARAADVMEELGRRYAGDKLRVTLMRDKQRVQCEITLAAKLEPFQHGFLGILPTRSAAKTGVVVRYVYPNSPAAKAGIAAGDVLGSLDGEPIGSPAELALRIGAEEPGDTVELEARRDGAVRKMTVTLAGLPENLPPKELPPAAPAKSRNESGSIDNSFNPFNLLSEPDAKARTGAMSLKIPEYANEIWTYVPECSASDMPYGVVVWLHPPGDYDWKQLLICWKPLCDRYGLILAAPRAADSARWTPGDTALVDRLLADVMSRYEVDPARVVVHGHQGGGALAFMAAFRNHAAIRAVAAVEAAPTGRPPENDPLHRLAVYVASAGTSQAAKAIQRATAAMRKMRIPVVVKDLGDTPRYLNAEELAELVRWIDTLDRI
jgi:serine protease Do